MYVCMYVVGHVLGSVRGVFGRSTIGMFRNENLNEEERVVSWRWGWNYFTAHKPGSFPVNTS